MNTEGERLRYYIENKEVSILNFCKKNDIVYTSLHPILSNGRPLGMNILKKIIEAYPNLNVNWILTGVGNIEINQDENNILMEPKTEYSKEDPGFEAFLKYLDKEDSVKKIYAILNKWKEYNDGKSK